VSYETSRRCVETNITRWPFHRSISFWYLSNMKYQLLFTSINPCRQTFIQHRTDLLQIAEPLESPVTCSYMQLDISQVEDTSWLSFICLWLVAYYIFLRTFHFSLWSSATFPQHQVSDQKSPQPGVVECESCRTMGTWSTVPLAETQQHRRHQLVHHDTAIADTENMV
jgi:hypothetical protein